MFKKNYKVETIVTPKGNRPMYKVTSTKRMTKKEATKLQNTRKIGLLNEHADYKWITYNVIDI